MVIKDRRLWALLQRIFAMIHWISSIQRTNDANKILLLALYTLFIKHWGLGFSRTLEAHVSPFKISGGLGTHLPEVLLKPQLKGFSWAQQRQTAWLCHTCITQGWQGDLSKVIFCGALKNRDQRIHLLSLQSACKLPFCSWLLAVLSDPWQKKSFWLQLYHKRMLKGSLQESLRISNQAGERLTKSCWETFPAFIHTLAPR